MAEQVSKGLSWLNKGWNWMKGHKKSTAVIGLSTVAATTLHGVKDEIVDDVVQAAKDEAIEAGKDVASNAFSFDKILEKLADLYEQLKDKVSDFLEPYLKQAGLDFGGAHGDKDKLAREKNAKKEGQQDTPEIAQNSALKVAEEIAREDNFKASNPGFIQTAWHNTWNTVSDKVKEWWNIAVGNPLEVKRDTQKIDHMMQFFKSKGWSTEQAAGIVANAACESNLDHKAVGDGGLACGIAQWHPARQADFKKKFGHDMGQSTFDEQLEFMHYELTDGSEKKAGNKLRATLTARDAGEVVSKYYERPADKLAQADKRGQVATLVEAHHTAREEVRLARNYTGLRGEGLNAAGQPGIDSVGSPPAPSKGRKGPVVQPAAKSKFGSPELGMPTLTPDPMG